jgi:hypothetical protein
MINASELALRRRYQRSRSSGKISKLGKRVQGAFAAQKATRQRLKLTVTTLAFSEAPKSFSYGERKRGLGISSCARRSVQSISTRKDLGSEVGHG